MILSIFRRLPHRKQAFFRNLARQRPAWMVSFAIEEASLSEGLRAASASTAMLLVGQILHNPLFSWAAIGAFWTCLADAAGSSRRRFASMMGFAVLSTVCGGLTALASGAGAFAACAAVLAVSFCAGLASIWSPAAYQLALVTATTCIVMVDSPMHSISGGAPLLGIYLSGCLVATVLSFSIWRIHPFGPSRYAVRLVYQRLSDSARDIASLATDPAATRADWTRHATEFRAMVRQSLEAARKALISLPQSRVEGRQLFGDLQLALDDADQILVTLIVVSTAADNALIPGNAPCRLGRDRAVRLARCLGMLAEVLARIALILEKPLSPFPYELRARLPTIARRLEQAMDHSLSIRLLSVNAQRYPPAATEQDWWRATLGTTRNALKTLRANLRPGSPGLRHAARLCLATTSAFVVVRSFHIPFGYWATMATLFVLQPASGTTLSRSLERAAGSAAGAALAAVIGLIIHSPLAISLVVFPLVCLTMGLRRVSYSLYVVFLTPSFVLVADFAKPANEFMYALDRLGNNLLGCLAAVLATWIVWSAKGGESLGDAVERAVETNLAYLAAAAGISHRCDGEIEALRRAAGLASTHAEEIYRRSWPSRTPQRRKTVATLSLLRRILGTAAVVRDSPIPAGGSAPFRDVVCTAIDKIHAQAHTSTDAPPGIPRDIRLRPIEYELLRQLMELWTLRRTIVVKEREGEPAT
ncbi:FUSC family protein [Paraburkholderia sp. UCT2]|uniref:FUSC family protein n=1 Tax=Paraburkholderia sp. UCT2 TaxID=2615208 RepID=UPI00165561AE|nr:FUSC family protein [Paraburkholderia sp. UCT2]MBC8728259.1 FUSC family protein [Paraburkholderia sp. UCT2]